MNADSAFHIGASHAVCQDYATAGEAPARPRAAGPGGSEKTGARPYVILSDGCSSSPDTDIGARLLVKAAERLLRETGGPPARGVAGLHAEAARLALAWAESLGLPPQAADATLLTAHLDGGELVVGCSGDGVVCLRTRAGALEVYTVAYPSGYPVYPSYAHQPDRLRALAEAGRALKEVRRFDSASVEEPLRPDGAWECDSPTEVFAFRAADYEFAALFSDGVHSFQRAGHAGSRGDDDGPSVPLDSVLRELAAFKNTRGSFVARRVNGFLKDCQRKVWRHADDLAVAALHLGGRA